MKKTCQIVDEIREHSSGTALWWLGNAGWAIKSEGVLLLVDPVIEVGGDGDPAMSEIGLPLLHQLPLLASELGERDVDLCLVTHGHGDHLAPKTISTLHERTRCRFVMPLSCTERARQLGLSRDRIIDARHGQAVSFEHLTIEPVKALHGHLQGSVYSGASFQDCGYVIRDDRWTIFHPGDSVLLQEHLEMAAPHVFLVSITEHNMWVRNSVFLANQWKPQYILPMHYDTYDKDLFWTIADPAAVAAQLDDDVRQNYVIVAQGERLLLGD